jgi:hypothetical protein
MAARNFIPHIPLLCCSHMKYPLLILLLLCCLQRGAAQPGNDLMADELKGRVKAVTETEYSDEAMKVPFMKTIDRYDPKGNLTESIHDDYVLKLHYRKTIKYDTGWNGLIIRRSELDDNGKPAHTVLYRYDTLNRLAEEDGQRFYDGIVKPYTNEYYYDSSGRKALEKNYSNAELDRSTTYTYDSKGRIAKTNTSDSTGKILFMSEYSYFRGGLLVGCEQQLDGVKNHISWMRDTSGRLIEKTIINSDYSKQTHENNLTFDQHGNWLKQSVKGTLTDNYFIMRSIEYYK